MSDIQKGLEAWSVMAERLADFGRIGEILKAATKAQAEQREREQRKASIEADISKLIDQRKKAQEELEAFRTEAQLQRQEIEQQKKMFLDNWTVEQTRRQKERTDLQRVRDDLKADLTILQQQKINIEATIRGMKEEAKRRLEEVTR